MTLAPTEPLHSSLKYLTFVLGAEHYAIESAKIREIMGCCAVTPVAESPDCMRGVLRSRGRLIPVIDPRHDPGAGSTGIDSEMLVLILEVHRRTVGLVIDHVVDTFELSEDAWSNGQEYAGAVDHSAVLGVIRSKGKATALLDIEVLFARDTLADVQEACW